MEITLNHTTVPAHNNVDQLAQDAFNKWHQQTGLPYTNISQILAYSIGRNYENEDIKKEQSKYG